MGPTTHTQTDRLVNVYGLEKSQYKDEGLKKLTQFKQMKKYHQGKVHLAVSLFNRRRRRRRKKSREMMRE